jgi:phosphate transport system protein
MSRATLDNELQGLDAQMILMGSLVDAALAQALKALEIDTQDRVGTVVVSDTSIDDLHAAIDEDIYRVLTLYQPLAGQDLRYLISLVPMAIDLERIGDEAEDIARNVQRMLPLQPAGPTINRDYLPPGGVPTVAPLPVQEGQDENSLTECSDTGDQLTEASMMQRILDLGSEVRSLLQWTMKAFTKRNAEAARSLWEQDKVVDQHGYAISRDLMVMLEGARAIPALQQDPHMVQRVTHLLWIVYQLGRIADHCTNLCERIVFLVEGETDIITSLEK